MNGFHFMTTFKEPFDDFDFGFPNLFNQIGWQNFRNLDSIWRQRLKGSTTKNFDSIFKRQHLQKEKSSTNKI